MVPKSLEARVGKLCCEFKITVNGLSACFWSRGWKIPYVYLTGYVRFTCGHPRGPCGFHTGMGTSSRSRADAMRAWEYPHDQWCRALRGPVGHTSARSCYIYQTKHDYVTFDQLGPGRLLTDAKSLLAQVSKLYMLNLQPRGIRHN